MAYVKAEFITLDGRPSGTTSVNPNWGEGIRQVVGRR